MTPTETKSAVATPRPMHDETPPSRRPGGRWARAQAYVRQYPLLIGFIAVGVIARIGFWAATDRKLDDAMITIKFDKNLADGFGLVHNFGEGHVQGFTSALSVLVPMPGELIYHGGGFLFIRLVSIACFALAAVYAYRIAGELGLGRWPTGFVLAFLALDQNQVFYGVAGMETQIASSSRTIRRAVWLSDWRSWRDRTSRSGWRLPMPSWSSGTTGRPFGPQRSPLR